MSVRVRNIFVVAHPEASHHIEGLVGGWFDTDLTTTGRHHAQSIARSLSAQIGEHTTSIYSSDLLRACRTAEVIGGVFGAPVTTDADLREKSFGEAEGKPQEWLRARKIPPPDEGDRLRHDKGIVGAETRWDLAQRSYRAIERIAQSGTDNQIVVTHGGTITLLIAAWLGIPIDDAGRCHFQTSPGSITWLRKDPHNFSHQLVQLSDTSHLSSD